MAAIHGQAVRFVVVGTANTLVTAGAFYALATVLPPTAAFTFVYVAGLALVVAVTPRFVFGASTSRTRRVVLALWYAGTYVVGVAVICIVRSALTTSRPVVVLGTVLVTAPLSFLGGRLLYSRGGSTPSG